METNREIGAAGDSKSVPAKPTLAYSSRIIFAAALVFAGYYLGAKIGFALTFQPHPISVLWPPNSILLAALLLAPRRMWWLLLLAALPAHWLAQLQSDVPPRMILCWFVSNCVEALIGAAAVRAFLPRPIRFDRMRNVAIFCFAGVLLGPFLSSFLDSAFVKWNHWGDNGYWELWRVRFSSNVLAALTIAPLIISAGTLDLSRWRKISRSRLIEGGALLLTLSAICLILFNKLTAGADPAFLYLPMPCLLWAAVRFKSRGATAAIALVAFLAIWGGAHGRGPFSENSAEENAMSVQLFLIFMSLPLLFLAALIEERDKGLKALREREERISLAAESANLVLWTVDFERGESWMSEKGRALHHFAPDERLSRDLFLTRVHPEDRAKVAKIIEEARNSPESFEAEYRLLLPDGETRWHMARGRYLHNERGQVSELIGIAIDVTAQIRADLDLRLQREEMTRLSRVALMGELTASLAHELNQPLTAIASNAAAGKRFLAKGPAELDLEMIEEILSDVFSDARRAGQIIHSIHHLVRKGPESRRAVDLNEVIRDVLRLLHSDLLGRSTTVKTDLAPSLAPVSADPVQLQQVLLNLIVNSLEAMQDTAVPQRRIEISTGSNNGSVEVNVRDHGVGLPEGDPDKIFSHFFSTKPNGMGMGLTIVRSIVEAHGGELGAENVEGGARFFFRLPAA
jgi:two-component system, LuxR family, sensor kinase FixL